MRAWVPFIKRRGIWYHKTHAHLAEVREASGLLPASGRKQVDGTAARRGDGWGGAPRLLREPPEGPYSEPRLRENGGHSQGYGLPAGGLVRGWHALGFRLGACGRFEG